MAYRKRFNLPKCSSQQGQTGGPKDKKVNSSLQKYTESIARHSFVKSRLNGINKSPTNVSRDKVLANARELSVGAFPSRWNTHDDISLPSSESHSIKGLMLGAILNKLYLQCLSCISSDDATANRVWEKCHLGLSQS
eukprot:scaffold993_cov110-Cylindrotheca_fusiformis.AAC.8